MENKKHSEDELKTKSLMRLREIGMITGVKLPTTLNKAELIKEILAVQSGEKQPYVKKKSGRAVITLGEIADRIEELRKEKIYYIRMYECRFHVQGLKKLFNTNDNEILFKKLSEFINML